MSAAKFAVRALGVVLVALGLWIGAADAEQQADTKPDAKGETERLLSQKAMMLEAYLGSQKVAEVLRNGEQKSVEVVERARADLADGADALGKVI